MREILTIDRPTRAIVHFASDEGRARLVYYQVLIDTQSPGSMSPSGEFIRFNHGSECEIHGWVRVEDLVIDELLETMEESDGRAIAV
jgi:hypothetical protein